MPRWSLVLLLGLSLVVGWRAWTVFWGSPAALRADLVANWAAVDTATSVPAYAWALMTLWLQKVYLIAAGAFTWQLEAVSLGAAGAWQLATQQPGQPDPLATFSAGINDTLHAWGVRPAIPAWRDAIHANLIDIPAPGDSVDSASPLVHILTCILGVTSYCLLTVSITGLALNWSFQYMQ